MLWSRTMKKWAEIGQAFFSLFLLSFLTLIFHFSLLTCLFLFLFIRVYVSLRILCKSNSSADMKQLLNNSVGRAVEFMECTIV